MFYYQPRILVFAWIVFYFVSILSAQRWTPEDDFRHIKTFDTVLNKTVSELSQIRPIEKDNIKLLGEDKMVQYYWDWFKSSEAEVNPWNIYPTTENTNTVHQDISMLYPPANMKLVEENSKSLKLKVALRLLIPIALLLVIL